MKDRQPTRPGRVKITPENGASYYAVMEMADEPTEVGTPPTKANLLKDTTAAMFGGDENMVPDDALVALKVLIDGVDALAGTKAKIASGTYAGTNTHLNKTFALGFRPKLFYIATASKSSGNNNEDIVQGAAGSSGGSSGVVYWIDGVNVPIYSISGKNYQDKFTFTPTDTGVKVVGVASGTSGSDYFNFNYSGCTYAYLGIG